MSEPSKQSVPGSSEDEGQESIPDESCTWPGCAETCSQGLNFAPFPQSPPQRNSSKNQSTKST